MKTYETWSMCHFWRFVGPKMCPKLQLRDGPNGPQMGTVVEGKTTGRAPGKGPDKWPASSGSSLDDQTSLTCQYLRFKI